MNWIKKIGRVAAVAVAMLCFVGVAHGQIYSDNESPKQVALSMSVSESLTVSATPASITFTYSPASGGTATASGPITVTTTAFLGPDDHNITTFAWLQSATAALTGPSSIPSSEVFLQLGSGTPVACTGTTTQDGMGVPAGASCAVQTAGSNGFLAGYTVPGPGASSTTDVVTLSLSGLGNLIPGTYSGVIYFESVAS